MTHCFRRFALSAALSALLALPAFAQTSQNLEDAYWTSWWSNDIAAAEEHLDAIAQSIWAETYGPF